MQQEATQEFVVWQSGELLFIVVSGIAPAKSHLAIGNGDEAMVGDGHAMGVAAEILQHILGTTEGTFQVDHPVFSKQWPEPSSEDLGFGEQYLVNRPSRLLNRLQRDQFVVVSMAVNDEFCPTLRKRRLVQSVGVETRCVK